MVSLKHTSHTLAVTATIDDWQQIIKRMEEPHARRLDDTDITIHFEGDEEELEIRSAIEATWKDGAIHIAVP